MAGAGSDDPTQMLTTLEGESDSIADVGHGSVRGVATTHYHAVIDLDKVAAPRRRRCAPRSTAPRPASSAMLGRHRMPMDVWIGADGLVRRRRLPDGDPGRRDGRDDSPPRCALDMFAFGAPVHVAAPAGRADDRPHRCCRGGCRLRIVSPA